MHTTHSCTLCRVPTVRCKLTVTLVRPQPTGMDRSPQGTPARALPQHSPRQRGESNRQPWPIRFVALWLDASYCLGRKRTCPWSGTSIRDTSCCCHPLNGVLRLRSGRCVYTGLRLALAQRFSMKDLMSVGAQGTRTHTLSHAPPPIPDCSKSCAIAPVRHRNSALLTPAVLLLGTDSARLQFVHSVPSTVRVL